MILRIVVPSRIALVIIGIESCQMQTLHDNLDDRANRWTLLAAFAGHFLRPFSAVDSVPPDEVTACERSLGTRLPKSLVEFYAMCGNATDIWCRQDEWLRPAELRRDNDVLVFWMENQGNWSLGIRDTDLALEDPPVVWDPDTCVHGSRAGKKFTVLAESVSAFALNMIAYVAKFFDPGFERPFGCTYDVDQFIDLVSGAYPKCQLQEEWVYHQREWYFQDLDTFVEVNETTGFVYPILKTPAALNRFCELTADAQFEWDIPPGGS